MLWLFYFWRCFNLWNWNLFLFLNFRRRGFFLLLYFCGWCLLLLNLCSSLSRRLFLFLNFRRLLFRLFFNFWRLLLLLLYFLSLQLFLFLYYFFLLSNRFFYFWRRCLDFRRQGKFLFLFNWSHWFLWRCWSLFDIRFVQGNSRIIYYHRYRRSFLVIRTRISLSCLVVAALTVN